MTGATMPMPEGIPQEIMDRLRAFLGPMLPSMAVAGVTLPEGQENAMPEVYLDADVLQVAQSLADICRGDEIYRMDREVVTIEEGTGRTECMTAARFVTWAGERAKFWKASGKDGKLKYETMTEQMAKLILLSDRFKSKIRPVEAVHRVRMPVVRRWEEGEPVVELLPLGYDAASRIFTVRLALDFDENMEVVEACRFFRELLGNFPFGDAEQGLGNQLAYMLTLFCRAMVAPSKVPAFVFLANLQGSGKSILAKLGLYTVFGKAAASTLSEPNELKKTLDMAARHATPYLFFDNLTGTLKSPLLDAWATTEEWTGRIIGLGEEFCMPTAAVLVMTGNSLKLSADLARRSVLVDLFADQTSAERPAPVVPLTERWLRRERNRRQLLASMWALVRYAFGEAGRAGGVLAGKALASFEEWSEVIPLVLVRCGFADPLVQVVLPDAGDIVEEDALRVIKAAIEEMHLLPGQSGMVGLAALVPVARRVGAFVERLGTIEDIMVKLDGMDRGGWRPQDWGDGLERMPDGDAERRVQASAWISPDRGADRGHLSSLGYHIRKRCGRRVTLPAVAGGEPQEYQFSNRASSRTSTFVVTRLR